MKYTVIARLLVEVQKGKPVFRDAPRGTGTTTYAVLVHRSDGEQRILTLERGDETLSDVWDDGVPTHGAFLIPYPEGTHPC